MKKIIFSAALLIALLASGVNAQPLAKEISFTSGCSKGVHVFDKASNSVVCGMPQASGSGYVVEMAMDANSKVQCPKGYDFIGHVQGGAMAGAGLQHFACAKI